MDEAPVQEGAGDAVPTPDQVRAAAAEMAGLLDEKLPERFYPSEPSWRAVLTATVARIGSAVEAIADLAGRGREPEIHVLLRSAYEYTVVYAWVAIDPARRVNLWSDDTMRRRRTLHNSLAPFGLEGLMTEHQLAEAKAAKDLRPYDQLAREADEFWQPRVQGLHVDPPDGPRSILTFAGLYVVIYRVASRTAHPSLEGLDWWAEQLPQGRVMVHRTSGDPGDTYAAIAVALFAIALTINHYRLGWPDAETVRQINDSMNAESDPGDTMGTS